jgi:hypothetical protein
MKLIITLFIFYATSALALDAVVTVLETPMLKFPSYDAPVVQYLRKGNIIKVHPSLNNNTDFDHLSPDPEKVLVLQKELEDSPEWKQDPLFQGKATVSSLEDDFIPTLDRQGHLVYVIKNHLYFYFNDRKEFQQRIIRKDPTDYRLEEPLPKKYPLYSPSGYRGQVTLGLTQPYYESYPYLSAVKNKGYTSPVDVNLTFLRQAPDDKQDRFYLGGTFSVKAFSNSYTLFNGVESKEQGIRLGIGPAFCYDAFKGQRHRLSLYGSLNVNFFNQLNISQAKDGIEEQRNYRSLNISPRLGFQYHRKQILEDVDFVLGTAFEVEPATTFRSNSAANKADWWLNRGSDKFNTRAAFSLGGYLGFQAAY